MEQEWRMLSYSRITGRGTEGLFRENPIRALILKMRNHDPEKQFPQGHS